MLSFITLSGGFAGAGAAQRPVRINAPFYAVALSTKPVLFVSNLNGGVLIYPADIHEANPPLLGTITEGARRPEGLWVDGKGTLYVVNTNPRGHPRIQFMVPLRRPKSHPAPEAGARANSLRE